MARPTRRSGSSPSTCCRASWPPPNGTVLRAGLEQRVKAINPYIRDVYGRREILKAGIVPEDLVFQNPVFRPEMNGQKVPHDIYVHIAGIDIVRVDRRHLLRARGQCPHAVRRLLHAGEPGDHAAAVSRAVRAPPRGAGRELSGRAARDAEIGRAASTLERRSDRRAAHARRLQLRLLRALLPGRQARRRAGRGPRPLRQGRRRLHAHDRRAASAST